MRRSRSGDRLSRTRSWLSGRCSAHSRSCGASVEFIRGIFTDDHGSEDSEKASELMITPEDDVHGIHGEPGDALGVQGYQIGRSVRSFDTACVFSFSTPAHCAVTILSRRRMDMQNERLPQFNPEMLSQPRFPAPSMRFQQQNGIDSQGTFNREFLVKKALEDDDNSDTVERIAEMIAADRLVAERPAPLKRFGTA